MTFSVNNAPWAGREGEFVTSRKLGGRIELEARRNVSVRVEQSGADSWRVLGRGELALAGIRPTRAPGGFDTPMAKPPGVPRRCGGALLGPGALLANGTPPRHIGLATQ